MNARDIEKLKAIGLRIQGTPTGPREAAMSRAEMELEQWAAVKQHQAQSPEGMKATMAAKVNFLGQFRQFNSGWPFGWGWTIEWYDCDNHDQPDITVTGHVSPQAAVDDLFWKVP